MKLIFFDIETTGIRVDKEKIVEIAAYEAFEKRSFASLVNPQTPIPQEASNIHGITDGMVANQPTFGAVMQDFLSFCGPEFIIVAHNGDSFDIPFLEAECKRANLPFPSFRSIDTLKWARKYRPDLPRHTLQFLRETFQIEANQAHRALDDVMVLYQVYTKMIDDLSPEQVLQLLAKATDTDRMPFGKHQGKLIKEVPKDYLKWLAQSGALEKPSNKDLREKIEKLGILVTA
jgi:DNA polymerase-3 subunit epsilon